MFTAPPRPPKDYVLKYVTANQLSSQEFTPDGEVRVTQSNLGKFCFPIPTAEDDSSGGIQLVPVGQEVLDKWAKEWRAYWVDKPGENAYFVHDMHKRYSIVVDPDYNPTYKHRHRIFNRPYKWELDCLEERRLKKLRDKIARDKTAENKSVEGRQLASKDDPMKGVTIAPCRHTPPFWWKSQAEADDGKGPSSKEPVSPIAGSTEYKSAYVRWQEEPNVLAQSSMDACERRDALLLVGQTFRDEAINFYYKNYPPPNIVYRPEKFSK